MLTEKQVLELGKSTLALVKKANPTAEARVDVWLDHRAHTRFARNEITTAGENDELTVSLHVQLGLRSASADLNQTDPASLSGLVSRTIENASLAPELPETMPVLGSAKFPKIDLHDAAMAKLDAKARAEGIAKALAPSREKDLLTAGYLEVHEGIIARLSSAGLAVAAPFTDSGFSVTARTKDGTGSGWNELQTRKAAELDFARVGRIAAEKAVTSAKPKTIDPGRSTVVLEPAAVADLFAFFVGSLDRRAFDEGRSPFVGKLGKQLADARITLRSDPTTGSFLPFDGEGQPLPARTWIDKGVLKELNVSRFWAKKKGLAPTGSYDGFEVLAGDVPRADLLKGIKRGVLITRFWYSNLVDPQSLLVTGLTRDGTFLIEDGAVAAPVRNFRINQSVIDALAKVDAVSVERESTGSGWKMPAMRTHEFLLASASDAV
jgi:predicted Zn-dependent protease